MSVCERGMSRSAARWLSGGGLPGAWLPGAWLPWTLLLAGCTESPAPKAPPEATKIATEITPSPTPAPERPDAEPEIVIEAMPAEIVLEVGEAIVEVEAAPAPAIAVSAAPKKRARRKAKRSRRRPQTPAMAKAPAAPTRLGRRTVMQTINAHMGDVQRCYAANGDDHEGRLVLQWTLGSDGQPTGVAVLQNTLGQKSVARCIKTAARRWRFPPPEGGVAVVTYPFNFAVQ